MREIPLTQGQVAKVDDEDYERVSQYKWCASWRPHVHGFVAERKDHGKTVRMHRLIMGAQTTEQVDHINHVTLDNRRCNLRICSNAQNHYNMSKRSGSHTSLFKGVHWHKQANRWRVMIVKDGQRHHVGLYDTELAAAVAYDSAARELFGDFAYTNF
jgi:hypothetical protein